MLHSVAMRVVDGFDRLLLTYISCAEVDASMDFFDLKCPDSMQQHKEYRSESVH